MAANLDFSERITRAQVHMQELGVDLLLVTPSADLRYLIGYNAIPLERLTALVIAPHAEPFLIVPKLEVSTAKASPFGGLGWKVIGWSESENPYELIGSRSGFTHGRIAVDNHMWAERVLTITEKFPESNIELAAPIINAIRAVKTPAELDHLRVAAAAIDRVHAQVPNLLRVGRTEKEVGRDIADLILAEGHTRVDFVIVASGPNGASPHHELSSRVIQMGDPVVVDIGGTMPSGYCSDCTRTYSMGDPGGDYLERYAALQVAQELSTQAVSHGAISHDIDAAGRNSLAEHGLNEYFIHRTGHGIGLETHEEPYIGENNSTVIENNMVFSIEPGFYIEGVHGARIEDIVICTPSGPESINKQTRDLVVVQG
jgi:Xaa-Pro aminopeptidase